MYGNTKHAFVDIISTSFLFLSLFMLSILSLFKSTLCVLGGVNIPAATLGIMTGGLIMRRLSLSVRGSALMCTVSVLVCIMFAVPLLFIGCPTQPIAGLNLSK